MKRIVTLFLVSMMVCSAMAWDALYIVGDGTSVGWDAGNAKPMNKISECEFEITDQFYNGQMKILCQQDWGSAYGPAHNEYSTLSENGKESFNQLVRNAVYEAQGFNMGDATAYEDYKFGTTAGWYTIHIDTEKMKISTWPVYLSPTGDGCSNEWVGWDNHTDKWKETDFASGIYSGDITLKTDGSQREFLFTVDNKYEYYVGPSTFNEWNHYDLEYGGIYDIAVRQSTDGEKRWYILDGGNGRTFQAKVNLKENKLYLDFDITFEFKLDGTAHTSWGDENPVGLYYWQYYAMEGEGVGDHVSTVLMSKDENDVYTAKIKAFNNVKFCVQSDLSEYHGSGHYTVEAEAAEQATGFTESKKFWIKDNGSGHFVELTENFDFTPAEMSVTLNDDGFASFYWDKNYRLEGADAYTGRVEGESVVLTKVNGNGIIPARSAVILYGSSGAHVTATETLDASTGYDFGNAFRGTLSGISETDVYVLGQTSEPHSTAFYYMAEANIPANRAYIKNVGAGAPLRVRFAEETVTGLESAEADVNVKKVVRDGRVLIIRDGKIYNTMGQIEKAF